MNHQDRTTPKCWQLRGWQDIRSDWNWEEYGGLWGKRASEGVWFFVEFLDLRQHMHESEINGDPLYSQVRQVDLREVSVKDLESAMQSCGPDDLEEYPEDVHELIHAEACCSYGIYAPLAEFTGTHPNRVRADAFRAAEEYMADEDSLESALDRPVNKIGSTARDFRGGNVMAGLERYMAEVAGSGEAPDATKNLMLKLHGVDAEKLAETPPQPVVKTVKQADLSAECWLVQIHGTSYCSTCEAYGKPECGGKEILRTGQNEKGVEVDAVGLKPDPLKPRSA